ncbi:MAG TPA: RloB family protein, partial [Asanoa sp.]|nr:RloB family protein [Asanoa sp.]
MRRRDSEPRRRTARRPERQTLLVYCGAVRTERDHFDGLKKAFGNPSVTVEVRGEGRSPAQLVRRAAAFGARRPGRYDQIWCVVDVDEFDIDAAVVEARRAGVHLAISNPCFELWLLLHHDDCRGALRGVSGCGCPPAQVGARVRQVPTGLRRVQR